MRSNKGEEQHNKSNREGRMNGKKVWKEGGKRGRRGEVKRMYCKIKDLRIEEESRARECKNW